MAKEDRGFASMDRAKQREIASKGGKAAHQKGTAHEWTSEEARDAGRKGGIASHQRRREQMAGPEAAWANERVAGSASERGSVRSQRPSRSDRSRRPRTRLVERATALRPLDCLSTSRSGAACRPAPPRDRPARSSPPSPESRVTLCPDMIRGP